MSAVISVFPALSHLPAAALMIDRLAGHLAVQPSLGADGSWEFRFDDAYPTAHARVVDTLTAIDSNWSNAVTVDYVLTA